MGARISLRGGKPTVTDGPFPETKEIVGGSWIRRRRGTSRPFRLKISANVQSTAALPLDWHAEALREAFADPGAA